MSQTNDSDVIDEEAKGDFVSMAVDGASLIPYKHVMFLFVIMVFVFSDFFNANVLSCFMDSMYMDITTTKGTLIQIATVLMLFVVVDLMIKNKVI